MRTIRRIYVYLVSLVSLEVIVWGVIGVTRTTVHLSQIGGAASDLAGSLALTLVGLPVFLLHWGIAQRSAARDLEERLARTRGLFFYGALAGTLIPAVQSSMAVINRLLLLLMQQPVSTAIVGSDQNGWDNLIALLVNGLAAWYLYSTLQRDRGISETLPMLDEVRRLYRVVWLIYGLGWTIAGVQMLVAYILTAANALNAANGAMPANALTQLVVGLPIWLFTWRTMQRAMDQPAERDSLLRWIVLFVLSLASVGTVLTTAGMVLADLLHRLLSDSLVWSQLLNEIRQPLSLAIPFGAVWAYYGSILQRQIRGAPNENRRAALHRLYFSILSALGIGAVMTGLILLCGYLVDTLAQSAAGVHIPQAYRLANALAVLTVSLPLWLVVWPPLVAEARPEGDEGDHARRSPIRKAYLYLALFAGVIGSMVSAWGTLSPLFNAWFGSSQANLGQDALRNLSYLVIFLAFLAYHWAALRTDGRALAKTLAQRQSRFNVLVIAAEEETLQAVQTAIRRHTPNIPVSGLDLKPGLLEIEPGAYQAVILPSSLAINPPPELRAWLDRFQGERLVLPTAADGWAWVGSGERPLHEWAELASQAVRLRAEGLPLRPAASSSPWVVAGYVFGGLFAVELLLMLASLLINLISG